MVVDAMSVRREDGAGVERSAGVSSWGSSCSDMRGDLCSWRPGGCGCVEGWQGCDEWTKNVRASNEVCSVIMHTQQRVLGQCG